MTDDRTAIAVISEISGVQNNHNHLKVGQVESGTGFIVLTFFQQQVNTINFNLTITIGEGSSTR